MPTSVRASAMAEPIPAFRRPAMRAECRRAMYPTRSITTNSAGSKTSLAGRLLWNGAAYYMDWKNLQTLLYDINICAPSSFNANVGDGRIYGVESNVDYKIGDHWSFQGSASYTDAHLVSSVFSTFAVNVGERLPYVPY